MSKPIRQSNKYAKRALIKVVFVVLGRALKTCYKLDTRVKKEFDSMPDNYKVRLGVKPFDTRLDFQVTENGIKIIKDKEFKPDLNIQFKSVESALPALTGMKSVASCYAEQRFTLFGDIMEGMSFIRAMNIVEVYLFPKFLTNILFDKQAPTRERTAIRVYLGTLLGI